jgi:hypothetical protein
VRSWTGWHRHITFALLAHAYLVVLRRQVGAIGGERTSPSISTPRCCRSPYRRCGACSGNHLPNPPPPAACPTLPLAQAGVILAPVRHLVLLLGNVMATVLVQLERHGGYPRSGERQTSYDDPALDAIGRIRAPRSFSGQLFSSTRRISARSSLLAASIAVYGAASNVVTLKLLTSICISSDQIPTRPEKKSVIIASL